MQELTRNKKKKFMQEFTCNKKMVVKEFTSSVEFGLLRQAY